MISSITELQSQLFLLNFFELICWKLQGSQPQFYFTCSFFSFFVVTVVGSFSQSRSKEYFTTCFIFRAFLGTKGICQVIERIQICPNWKHWNRWWTKNRLFLLYFFFHLKSKRGNSYGYCSSVSSLFSSFLRNNLSGLQVNAWVNLGIL